MARRRDLLALLVAVLAASAARPQEEPRAGLEEIVVTARKRPELLQEVPLSVTALSGKDLLDSGYGDLTSIDQFTPNLWFESTDPSRSFIFIRGIGTRQYDSGSDPSVGVFVDGVYQGRFSSLNSDFASVERVEVLKGPQGTLYGRNTIGGAISIVTLDPAEEWEGGAAIEGGFGDTPGDQLFNVSGSVSGPIVRDTLTARFAFARRTRDGWTRILGREIRGNSEETLGFRTKIKWVPAERWSLRLSASAVDVDDPPVVFVNNDYGDPNTPVFGKSPRAPQPAYPDSHFEAFADAPIFLRKNQYAVSLMASRSGDLVDITSITAFQTQQVREIADADGTDLDILRTPVREDADQVSEELRAEYAAEAFSLVVGLYYGVEKTDRLDIAYGGRDSVLADANFFQPVLHDFNLDVTAVGYAAFGQLDWKLLERLTLTAGLRVSRDEKDADYDARGNAPLLATVLETYRLSIGKGWTSVDPLLSLRYDLLEDTMVYATYASGFKAGAFQWIAFTDEIAREIVDPETVDNYEIGAKSTFLDGQVRANLAAFWMDYSDLQQLRLITIAGALVRTKQANAAASTIRGVELEGTGRILDSLSADFSYAFLDARYDEYVFDDMLDFSGNRLPRAPQQAASIALNYMESFPLGDLAGRISYAWRDSFFFESDNNEYNKATDERPLGLVDASIGATRGSWSVSLWGTNLTNEAYRTHMVAFGPNEAQSAMFAAPRTLGIRVGAAFR